MRLRPYQERWLNDIREAHKEGHQGVIGQMPTGGGKTVAGIGEPCKRILARGGSVLLLVHRDELVKQTADKLNKFGLPYGIIAAKWGRNPAPTAPIQIAMVQTLRNRETAAPSYIIVDECHLAAAKTYVDIFDRFPNTMRLGLTATPCRMDGVGFERLATALVTGPTVREMNEIWRANPISGLVPSECWSIPGVDLAAIQTNRHGEYDQRDAADHYEKQALIGSVVGEYIKHAKDRRGLVFCTSVSHSERVRDEFLAKGIRAAHIDGTTPKRERDQTLDDLNAGRVQVVTNCAVLIEGLDITGISAVSLAVPTGSLSKYLQMVGRASRPHPGKDKFVVIDHGGCVLRHGTPDHEREWQIEGRKKKSREKGVIMSLVCGECYFSNPPDEECCLQCGEELRKPRELNEKAGDLVKVEGTMAPMTRDQIKLARAARREEIENSRQFFFGMGFR